MPALLRPKPFLDPQYCKGCLRCIEACPRDCITPGDAINPATGLVPVELNLENCNGCALCLQACPEPYGLRLETDRPGPEGDFVLEDPAKLFGEKCVPNHSEGDLPDDRIALPACEPMVLKGTYASAIGALLAGCRHVFGYPITPATSIMERLASEMPKHGARLLQTEDEIAAMSATLGAGFADSLRKRAALNCF